MRFRLRPIDGWGWALFSGIAALILGVMIWRQFPVSGTGAVGILVGIQLIFTGIAIASICNAAQRHEEGPGRHLSELSR